MPGGRRRPQEPTGGHRRPQEAAGGRSDRFRARTDALGGPDPPPPNRLTKLKFFMKIMISMISLGSAGAGLVHRWGASGRYSRRHSLFMMPFLLFRDSHSINLLEYDP